MHKDIVVTFLTRERAEGSVITFEAIDPDGFPILVAVDQRMAYAISDALRDGPVKATIAGYQVIGHPALKGASVAR